MDDFLFEALLWAFPVYVGLQWFAARAFAGGWRLAAFLPLLVMGPLLAFTLLAAASGSNLSPLLLIFASPPACLYLVGLILVRWLRQR